MTKTDKRTKLGKIGNQERHTFTAIFGRYGYKSGYHGESPTILLKYIKLDGRIITEHLWCNLTGGFKGLNELHEGDAIQFDGRITSYTKGYQGYREDIERSSKKDYKIERPTKLSVINKVDKTTREVLPEKDWEVVNWIRDNMPKSNHDTPNPTPKF
ncbi:hypothetical protein ABC418_11405 [Lactiplantibacillus plantarum]|uniref:hypothetical protein n=1 Tax=Lactiplantibacillus plantarum TaxID=1590 RepID=UPI003965AAEB